MTAPQPLNSDCEQDLGHAELAALKVLWTHAPCTVREVMNQLNRTQGRELAYTTVLTFLTRLEQKGFARSDKSGVAYIYRPTVDREHITRTRVRAVVEQLFDGEVGPLVLQLVDQECLSRDELEKLRSMIDRHQKNQPGSPSHASSSRYQGDGDQDAA